MNWITVIWSAAAGISLAFGVVHLLVWLQSRNARANLIFGIAACAGAVMTLRYNLPPVFVDVASIVGGYSVESTLGVYFNLGMPGNEARKLFTTELSVPVLATSEFYGSMLVAAMNRQHPRDPFDVRGLFERSRLTAEGADMVLAFDLAEGERVLGGTLRRIVGQWCAFHDCNHSKYLFTSGSHSSASGCTNWPATNACRHWRMQRSTPSSSN